MLRGLLPKEFHFFDFFDKAAEINVKATNEFYKFCKEGKNLSEYAQKIKSLEKEGDTISHQGIEALHQTFITPIERADIFELIKKLDDIIDNLNSAVSRMELYGIKELREETIQFAEVLYKCTIELAAAIKELRDLKNFKLIKEKLVKVHDLEHEADIILKKALLNLFQSQDAMLVIKWKEVFERLEKAVDKCETLSYVIEGIIIDNA